MSKKFALKILCVVMAFAILVGLTACGSKPASEDSSKAAEPEKAAEEPKSEAKAEETKKAEPVTLRFLSNLPDRTANQGKLEQMLMDNYMKENPNVKIEVEALQDDMYKQKFKAYSASNNLPDLYYIWGITSLFRPVVDGGYLIELNPKDYESYGFLPNSTDGFMKDGKLYGLPKNTDMFVLYYNKKMFDDNGIKVPATFAELIEAIKAFRAKGITPCAVNGKDRWLVADMLQELTLKASGDKQVIFDAVDRKVKFAENPAIIKGAEMMKELMDNKFYQDSFSAADYGAANNLFAQGKAAMYYMGSWEMGMATNDKLPEEFRNNLHAIAFPPMEGTNAKATDLFAFNGSGYGVSSTTKQKDEAIKFLNYIFLPDNWAKNAWQMGVCFPAQKFDKYMTGNESGLQKELVGLLGNATSLAGVPWIDYTDNSEFKEATQDLSQRFALKMIGVDEYLKELDKAADKAAGK